MATASEASENKQAIGRVLIVEDDAVLALASEAALRDAGAEEVVICDSTEKAMRELERGLPDVIILDVHLADRDDGWAVAELATQLAPRNPQIIFSTGSPDEIPEAISKLGTVLAKPYDSETLVAAIEPRKRGLLGRLRKLAS